MKFYLASSKIRSIQQMLLDSNNKFNPKQLPRLAEKRTIHLTAVPSHAISILKNQILNSLLCLNSHWLQYCWITLLSNPEYQLCSAKHPINIYQAGHGPSAPLVCAHTSCGVDMTAHTFSLCAVCRSNNCLCPHIQWLHDQTHDSTTEIWQLIISQV